MPILADVWLYTIWLLTVNTVTVFAPVWDNTIPIGFAAIVDESMTVVPNAAFPPVARRPAPVMRLARPLWISCT